MSGQVPSLGIQFIILLTILLVNAFLSASEIAILSIDKDKFNEMVENDGNKKAKNILDIANDRSKFISIIKLSINLCCFFAASLISNNLSNVIVNHFEIKNNIYITNGIFILVVILLSIIMLLFGELIPKRIVFKNSDAFAFFAINPIRFVLFLLKPFHIVIIKITNLFMKIFGVEYANIENKLTLEEIKSIVEVGKEQGVIDPIEKEMIDSVIGFDEKTAEEIMTARTEVFMIDIDSDITEYISEMLELKYSRIPVYEEAIDNIIGILYIKDFLLESYKVGFKKVNIRKIIKPAYFVPERKNINELFIEMQTNRRHMAILIDEYGGFSGLVTMEDLIEEIMGDIDDEYDHDEPDIKVIDKNNFYVSGTTSIKEFNSKTGLELDENSDDYDTIGGYLMYRLGYIPEDGKKKYVKDDIAEYFIDPIEDKRIQNVRVKISNNYKKEEEE